MIYAKMASLFTTHEPTQEHVNTVDLEGIRGRHTCRVLFGHKPFTTMIFSFTLVEQLAAEITQTTASNTSGYVFESVWSCVCLSTTCQP